MKGLVLYGQGDVRIAEVPVPEIGDDDILLEVKACGICGSDLHTFYGVNPPMADKPVIMGHEFAGVIVKRGEKVSERWQVGDRVVSDNTGDACGVCPSCENGHFVACQNRKILGCDMDGGFAKYVKIPGRILQMFPNCLFHIPENLSFEEATLMDPAANGYNAVVEQGEFKSGENIVVFGSGALGLMALQQAVIAGAANAILVGLTPDKVTRFEIGKKLGATHVFASDEDHDFIRKIHEICGESGVALVVDAAGVPIITKQAIQIVRNEGKIVRIGMSKRGYDESLDQFMLKNVSLVGHMGYNAGAWRKTLNLAKTNKIDMKTIITGTLPLSRYQEGFDLVKSQKASKIILIPED